jgi:hypothetical protein
MVKCYDHGCLSKTTTFLGHNLIISDILQNRRGYPMLFAHNQFNRNKRIVLQCYDNECSMRDKIDVHGGEEIKQFFGSSNS